MIDYTYNTNIMTKVTTQTIINTASNKLPLSDAVDAAGAGLNGAVLVVSLDDEVNGLNGVVLVVSLNDVYEERSTDEVTCGNI